MKLRDCSSTIKYKPIPLGKQICNDKVWDVGWEGVGMQHLYSRIRLLVDPLLVQEIHET